MKLKTEHKNIMSALVSTAATAQGQLTVDTDADTERHRPSDLAQPRSEILLDHSRQYVTVPHDIRVCAGLRWLKQQDSFSVFVQERERERERATRP